MRRQADAVNESPNTPSWQAELLNLAREGIFVRDMKSVIKFWSRGAMEMYGWRDDEAIGQMSHELLQTQFPKPHAEIEVDILRTSRWDGTLTHRRRDGSTIIVDSRWALQRDGTGQPVVILEINTDITERKQADEALRESESRFRNLFENSPDAVFVEDENGMVLDANYAACQLHGIEREKLIGKNVLDLVPDDKREAVARQFRQWFTRESTHYDGWAQDTNHRIVPVAITGSRIMYEGKSAIVLHVRDVTEQKQAEAALRQLSVELLRSQDEERRRIARELHDATGQKLAAIAMHLSKISEFAESLDPAARKALAESTVLLDRCSSEVRTLSYLLHPPLLDERGLASALRWFGEGFAQRSGISIGLDVPANLPRLPQEIEMTLFRIVQEGLTNVHRHSGSPTAAIRLRADSESVNLEVRDAGKGFLNEKADGAPTLGVGIAGMRERVKQLGGSMEVESRAAGATIRVSLPLKDVA